MAKKKQKKSSQKTAKKKSGLSPNQKRHKAVLKGVSSYNKGQSKSEKLNRKQFWQAYRVAKKETLSSPIRGLSNKISKIDWEGRVSTASLPKLLSSSNRGKFPSPLKGVLEWYRIVDYIEKYGQGYFIPDDIFVFDFSDRASFSVALSGLNSISFLWDDYRTKGAVVIEQEIRDDDDFYIIVSTYSPPPTFLYNPSKSNPSEGIFFWSLDKTKYGAYPTIKTTGASQSRTISSKKPKTTDDIVADINDEDTLKQIMKSAAEKIKKIKEAKLKDFKNKKSKELSKKVTAQKKKKNSKK